MSVYSPLRSFTDSSKSSARVRKCSEKTVFAISQPNIHNSVTSKKLNTRIKISVKFNIVGPAHNISKVSSKVYLINANRVLRKDLLKPRSLVTCNLTHKAANVPHVKLDIRKPSNNQSSTLSPNVLATSCLNTRKQPSPANIPKPSSSVTKLSPLKARKSAHRKSHYDRGADNNISTNHLRYKSNHFIESNHLISSNRIICVTNRIIYGGNITSRNFYLYLHTRIFAFTHFYESLWVIWPTSTGPHIRPRASGPNKILTFLN